MKIIFLFFLFITNSIYFSIDKLVTALKIKNSEEVINYLSLEGEIVINGFSSKGNKYKMIKVLDDFYYNNDITDLNIIHKGNSENNLIYILGEYISNHDIYKLLVLINSEKNEYKIEKIKIDIEK